MTTIEKSPQNIRSVADAHQCHYLDRPAIYRPLIMMARTVVVTREVRPVDLKVEMGLVAVVIEVRTGAANMGLCFMVIVISATTAYRRMTEALASDETQAEAFDLIRSLLEEITLVLEDGELKVELKGDLAGILQLCSTSKSPSSLSPERLEQVKLVAGACNQRYLRLVERQIPKLAA